ncbi:MAG: hypothetical protein ACI4XR_04030 [Bacilli bacterium]
MEKIIEIDIHDKYDLVEKYNEDKIANGLIDYVVKESLPINKNEKIKIIINIKCKNIDKDCSLFLKEGLTQEYNKSLQEHKINQIKEFYLLLLGIIFLLLSRLINNESIWKEILLITGWVPIWEVVDIVLFSNTTGKGKRKIIKKLYESEIIVNNN